MPSFVRAARAAAGTVAALILAMPIAGCSAIPDLTGSKHPGQSSSAAVKDITSVYRGRVAALGSNDITQLLFYNGNVSVTGWVGTDLMTATQMGTLIPAQVETGTSGGSLAADRFDVISMNARLATSPCKKDPMLMASVAPSGAILESLYCAGNILHAAAWLDGKPLPPTPSTIDENFVSTIVTTASATLGTSVDIMQIMPANSYARANVQTPHGKSTVITSFPSGGTPTLSLVTPTLNDAPKVSLTAVTGPVVWAAIRTALGARHATAEQIQIVTVMVTGGRPVVTVILIDGSRSDIPVG